MSFHSPNATIPTLQDPQHVTYKASLTRPLQSIIPHPHLKTRRAKLLITTQPVQGITKTRPATAPPLQCHSQPNPSFLGYSTRRPIAAVLSTPNSPPDTGRTLSSINLNEYVRGSLCTLGRLDLARPRHSRTTSGESQKHLFYLIIRHASRIN